MPYRKFPDADPAKKYVLAGDTLGDMFNALTQDGNLTAAPPLMIKDGPGGKVLSIALPLGVVLLRLTGTATGAGTYNARVQQVTTNTQSTSTDLNLATWVSDLNTSDDAVFENTVENHAAAGSHSLPTGANSFVVAFLAQRFASDTSPANRPIYIANISPSGIFPVNLTQSGGSNGSAGVVATYTYNATDARTGATITGGPFSVTWARRAGPVTAATHGHGYYDSSGNFVLDNCDEQIQIQTC